MKINDLLQKFDIVYPDCGFYVGEGWLPLIEQAFEQMIALGWDKKLTQIKEKFGQLRIYIGTASPEVHRIIAETEKTAGKICASCGNERDEILVNSRGWVTDVCKTCFKRTQT